MKKSITLAMLSAFILTGCIKKDYMDYPPQPNESEEASTDTDELYEDGHHGQCTSAAQ